MIIKPELVKRIKDYFNLNIYEAKVWLALLSKGVASAREVADISGIPRSRTYDVLESLEKRGFAITRIGKPVKYISVKPTEVIEKMKSNVLLEAQEKVSSLIGLKGTSEYVELEQLHNSGIAPIKAHDITGSLKGRSNILSRLRELLDSAKSEVIICTSVADFENKSRILLPALEKLNKESVKVKLSLAGDPEQIKKINAKYNLKAKQTDSTARLYIADKKETFFMVTPEHSEEEMGVWLQSPFFTSSITQIIEYSMKNGLSR
ncbi:MAG: helix-turn-helix domain-containing protein [Nanoarchaeota archaeon]|mgnify:CR=1 FL=1